MSCIDSQAGIGKIKENISSICDFVISKQAIIELVYTVHDVKHSLLAQLSQRAADKN